MIHAIICWTQQTKTNYWPIETQHALYLNNILPLQSCRFLPMEILSGIITNHKNLHNIPVWSFPVYVLHLILQLKGKLTPWQPKIQTSSMYGLVGFLRFQCIISKKFIFVFYFTSISYCS